MRLYFVVFVLSLSYEARSVSWTRALLNPTETCPRLCSCYNRIVDCRARNLTRLPPSHQISNKTIVLDLRFNKLQNLPPNGFRRLKSLMTLLLNENQLKNLDERAFYGLHNLKHLFLNNNQIRSMAPKTFQYNINLSDINLNDNPLVCSDCHLAWIKSFHSIRLNGTCSYPDSLRGQNVMNVSINCDNEDFGLIQAQRSSVIRHDTVSGVPFISQEPNDADVIPGGTAVFMCQASGSPIPNITWKKNGIVIRSSTKNNVQTSHGRSILRIFASSEDDIGQYQCEASSNSGLVLSRIAKLRYYRGRSKPQITHRPTPIDVVKGDTIRLTCGATGFPRPTFSWFKDGGRLSSFHDRFRVEEDGTLTITNAQLDDSAHYRCSATNYLGRASSAVRVQVNLAIPESKPKFTSTPRTAKIVEGGIVEFTCIAIGHPMPETTWWKNNRIVNSDNRISVSNSGQHLRIQNIENMDRGDYVCRAENRLGRSEVTTTLEVQSRPSPVIILVGPHDMTAPNGATIQLPCRAEGSPQPTITWKKDGRIIDLTEERFRKSPDGSIVVFNVSLVDQGVYECVAENNQERRTVSATFNVRNNPEIVRPINQRNPIPSTFIPPTRRNPIVTEAPRIEIPVYSSSRPGDEFLLSSFDSARMSVFDAINATVESFVNLRNFSTPHELAKLFRFPGSNAREVARAAEVFELTLNLVEEAVRQRDREFNLTSAFGYEDLISPENLFLLGNLSGCESHRSDKDFDCSKDLCYHNKYRTIDGTCNHFEKPLWGASLTVFTRLMPSRYENGFNAPVGWTRDKLYHGHKIPSARKISSELIYSSSVDVDDKLSHMAMQWGQFLDHDLDHSMEAISRQAFEDGITCSGTCGNRPPCFPIEIPLNDPRVDKHRCMEFTRSSSTCGSGSTSVFFKQIQPREQLNQITSFIDGSQIYGSDYELSQTLRNLTNDFGRLREEPSNFDYFKPFMPFNEGHPVDCRRDPRLSNIGCFLAGDSRANEQLGLLSMHTLWFRQHNYIASRLRELNPTWDGDRLFQESRKIVGAQLQKITYTDWLPLILGSEGMELLGSYSGYDPSVNPSISNAFATSGFRFGHTMVKPVLRRLNENFTSIDEGDVSLHEAFFAPWRLVQEGGVDPILRGLFASSAKKPDPTSVMNEDLTEKLFSAAHEVALDLGALNIQRGRDHGLKTYVEWRYYCGLDPEPIHSWDQLKGIIPNATIRRKMKNLYGHPANVDLWVGSVAEPILPGAKVGPTFRCLILDQFKRLRSGDRFWYENPSTFTSAQLQQLKQTTLARILCDNGDQIRHVAKNVFKYNKDEPFLDCEDIPEVNLNPWFECDTENARQPSSRSRRDSLYEERDGDPVCIDFEGNIIYSGETWIHRDKRGSCALCVCEKFNIICRIYSNCVR